MKFIPIEVEILWSITINQLNEKAHSQEITLTRAYIYIIYIVRLVTNLFFGFIKHRVSGGAIRNQEEMLMRKVEKFET